MRIKATEKKVLERLINKVYNDPWNTYDSFSYSDIARFSKTKIAIVKEVCASLHNKGLVMIESSYPESGVYKEYCKPTMSGKEYIDNLSTQ